MTAHHVKVLAEAVSVEVSVVELSEIMPQDKVEKEVVEVEQEMDQEMHQEEVQEEKVVLPVVVDGVEAQILPKSEVCAHNNFNNNLIIII